MSNSQPNPDRTRPTTADLLAHWQQQQFTCTGPALGLVKAKIRQLEQQLIPHQKRNP